MGEFAAGGQGVRVCRAEDPLPAGEGLLKCGDRLVTLARAQIGLAQVLPGGQGVRVPGAPALLGFGENALGEADRLLGAARPAVGAGEVGARRSPVRMNRAEEALPF